MPVTTVPVHRNKTLHLLFLVTLLSIMPISLIAPILPTVGKAMEVSPEDIGWVITSYTLPGVLFAILFGILSDKLGRKQVLIPGLLIFGFFGGFCYFATDFFTLNTLRFLQGIGGAILGSLVYIFIGDLFVGTDRIKAMGLNAAVLSMGTGIFPFIGGGLALIQWNLPFLGFFLAIPMAVIVYLYLDNPREIESSSLRLYTRDCKKYLLNWNTLVLFFLGTLTFMLLFGGILTYLSMYLSVRFNLSPMTIGMFLGGSSLITAGIASQAGRISKKINPNRMLVFSFVLYAISFLLIPWISHVALMMIPILLFGLGMGLNVPVIQDVAAGIAPAEYRGLMVSSLGTLIRLGQTLGPILFGWILFIGDLSLIFLVALIVSIVVAVTLEQTKMFSSIKVSRD